MRECLGAAPVGGSPSVPGQGPGTGLWGAKKKKLPRQETPNSVLEGVYVLLNQKIDT